MPISSPLIGAGLIVVLAPGSAGARRVLPGYNLFVL